MRPGLPGPQPGTGTKMHEKTVDNTPPLLSGETRDLLPDGWDEFSRTPEELKDMGVRDDEVITYIRNPAEWQQYEHKDRSREFKRETPGGRILTDEKGHPFIHGDTLVAAMPRALFEERERQRQRETAEFDAQTENPEETEFAEIPRFKIEPGQYGARAQQQHQRNVQAGLIGGQFAGMPVEMVVKQIGKERYEAEQAKYRNGGRHQTPTRSETQEGARGDRQEAYRQSQGGGKIVSIPAGVRPRNTMAAAAARKG